MLDKPQSARLLTKDRRTGAADADDRVTRCRTRQGLGLFSRMKECTRPPV